MALVRAALCASRSKRQKMYRRIPPAFTQALDATGAAKIEEIITALINDVHFTNNPLSSKHPYEEFLTLPCF